MTPRFSARIVRLSRACTSFLAAAMVAITCVQASAAEKKPPQLISLQVVGSGESNKELGIELSPRERSLITLSDRASIGPLRRDKTGELDLSFPYTDPAALAAWRAKNPGQPDPGPGMLPVVWRPVAKVNLPDSANVLILVHFSGDRILGYQVFDQSEKALPSGRVALHSMLPRPIAIELGTERLTLGARETQRLVSVSTPTGRAASVRLSFAIEDDGQWQLLDRTTIVMNPQRRRHVLVVPGGAAGVSLLLLPPAPADPQA